MKRIFIILIFSCFIISGCSLVDNLLPSQFDATGNAIPGSRQPIAVVDAVAESIPYAPIALNMFLLILAGVEKFKANKLEKGLKATLLAGKQVATDPELEKQWEKIKEKYRQAHENAGVTSLIKLLLAKLPTIRKGV